jgi:hypothetical protein
MSAESDPNKKIKQSYVLSCLGSLSRRQSSLQGKLRAMFSREKVGDWNKLVTVRGDRASAENRLPDSDEDEGMDGTVQNVGEDKNVSEGQGAAQGISGPAPVEEEKVVERQNSGGRVVKRKYRKMKRKNKKTGRKNTTVAVSSDNRLSIVREVFANAKVNSKGDLTARVGKKFQ